MVNKRMKFQDLVEMDFKWVRVQVGNKIEAANSIWYDIYYETWQTMLIRDYVNSTIL